MKWLPVLILFLLFRHSPLHAQFSERGYPEHFVAGVLIGGAVSYYTFKKSDDKLKSWILGTSASALTGLLKEIVDPVLFNSTRNMTDFAYTALGGAVGASIIIPIRSKKRTRLPLTSCHCVKGKLLPRGIYMKSVAMKIFMSE